MGKAFLLVKDVRLWLALLCCALLALVALRNWAVSALADERTDVNLGTLTAAARAFPDAARLQARLAGAELESSAPNIARAEAAALKATRLLPQDYRMWLRLAQVREAQGDLDGQELALRTALARAPNYAEVRWLLANCLVRTGKLEEAINEFARVAAVEPSALASSFDLIWQLSDGDLKAVSRIAGNKPAAQLALSNFLLARGRIEDAIRTFAAVQPAERRDAGQLDQSAAFINTLNGQGQTAAARRLWFETLGQPPQPLYNGDFENQPVKSFNQFDWLIGSSKYANISISSKAAHTGQRSLRVSFLGEHTTRLEGEVRQMIAVRPGAAYRLKCFAKTEALVTTEGPTITLTEVTPSKWSASSAPIASSTSDWAPVTLDFLAPQKANFLWLTIKRTPHFSYDEPMTGTVWLDDFRLIEK